MTQIIRLTDTSAFLNTTFFKHIKHSLLLNRGLSPSRDVSHVGWKNNNIF